MYITYIYITYIYIYTYITYIYTLLISPLLCKQNVHINSMRLSNTWEINEISVGIAQGYVCLTNLQF